MRLKIKNQLLFLLLTASAFSASAQSQLRLGIEGGAGISSLHGNPVLARYHRPTLSVYSGLYVQYRLKGPAYLRLGAGVGTKGSQLDAAEITDENGNVLGRASDKNSFLYATVPLMAGVRLGTGKTGFYVQAGPYLGFLLDAKREYRGGVASGNISTKDNFKSTDFGIAAGAGFELPLASRIGFTFELRDELGLTNASARTIENRGAIRHNALRALIGLHVRL